MIYQNHTFFRLVNMPLCLMLICLLFSVARGQSPATRPHIIIFLADDMGMGDTSVYQDWSGNPGGKQLHTPAMDRLARMGIRFTDAHSPSSRCSPSRYALLTGRYSWRTRLKHGVLFGVHCDPLIEPDRLTLPEFLRQYGYYTGMLGKWHLGVTYRQSDGTPATGWDDADLTQLLLDGPIDHGFSYFYGFTRSHGTSGPGVDRQGKNKPDQHIGPGWIHNRRIVGATGTGKLLDDSYRLNTLGNELDEKAMAFLEEAAARPTPFFFYFASPANHTPYTPSDALGDIPVAGASKYVDGTETGSRRLDFIYQNDVHIARLMTFLQTTPDRRRPGSKLIENTLFIFTSDNGAERNDKVFTGPLRSNKASTYEGGHRIPFITSWPLGGIGDGNPDTPGQTCKRLLALNDMYATIAEIIEKPLPPLSGRTYGAEDSISQLAALRGEAWSPRPPIFPNDHKEASRRISDQRAWIAVRGNDAPLPGEWKLFLDHSYAWKQKLNPKELYNLADDPMEQKNLIDNPQCLPALDYLLEHARRAAGDHGYTRDIKLE